MARHPIPEIEVVDLDMIYKLEYERFKNSSIHNVQIEHKLDHGTVEIVFHSHFGSNGVKLSVEDAKLFHESLGSAIFLAEHG